MNREWIFYTVFDVLNNDKSEIVPGTVAKNSKEAVIQVSKQEVVKCGPLEGDYMVERSGHFNEYFKKVKT